MTGPGHLFAHLGAHKTGSTFLQHVFAAEAPRLAEAGITYLPHRAFRRAFSRRLDEWRRDPAGPDSAAAVAHALLAARTRPAGRPRAVLVSDETLLGHLRTDLGNAPDRLYEHCRETVALLRHALGPRGTTVLLVIRRLDEFVEGAFLQLVRLGETTDFAPYAAGLDLPRLSWLPTVEEIASVLTGPDDRLVVYDHAWLRAAPEAALADLFDRMDAPPPARLPAAPVNPSYTEAQYRAVAALNRAWPRDRLPLIRRAALAAAERAGRPDGSRARFLDDATRDALGRRHAADLAAIASFGGIVELASPRPTR